MLSVKVPLLPLLLMSLMTLTSCFYLRNCGRQSNRAQKRWRPKRVWQGPPSGDCVSEKDASWEFGTFTSKKLPSKEDLVNFEEFKKREGVNDNSIPPFWIDNLSEEHIDKGIETLKKLCSADRLQKFDNVLNARTQNVRFVYENPANANNVWASLRTLDAFGVQYIDVITEPSSFHSEWRREVWYHNFCLSHSIVQSNSCVLYITRTPHRY